MFTIHTRDTYTYNILLMLLVLNVKADSEIQLKWDFINILLNLKMLQENI